MPLPAVKEAMVYVEISCDGVQRYTLRIRQEDSRGFPMSRWPIHHPAAVRTMETRGGPSLHQESSSKSSGVGYRAEGAGMGVWILVDRSEGQVTEARVVTRFQSMNNAQTACSLRNASSQLFLSSSVSCASYNNIPTDEIRTEAVH